MHSSFTLLISKAEIGRKLKWLLLVVLPSWLPKSHLHMYWYFLSNMQGFIRKTPRIIEISNKVLDGQELIEISFSSDEKVTVQSSNRVSRFLSGPTYAQDRLWEIYIGQFQIQPFECNDSTTILDIGANIGEFSLASHKRFAATVYAFEPDPKAYRCLVSNIESSKASGGIRSLNLAAGKENGFQDFYLSTVEADSSLMPILSAANLIQVEVLKLQDFMEREKIERVSLLKMDAEGYEPEVLMGLGKSITKIQTLTIDVSEERIGSSTFADVSKIVSRYGFDFKISSKINSRKILVASRNWLKQ